MFISEIVLVQGHAVPPLLIGSPVTVVSQDEARVEDALRVVPRLECLQPAQLILVELLRGDVA